MSSTDFEKLRDALKKLSPLQLKRLQGEIQLALVKRNADILSREERDALARLFA